ncbi:MAG: LLM class flavin-dependent oxidoreductase, partial [Candidatus Limnocylindria bacterium]|nr:LLM class flavin-dependent oxidoreductase [Candidatus Limnocylindria bacterium]
MVEGRAVAKQLGRVGIWSNTFERLPSAKAGELARLVEGLGFGAIWFPEAVGSKEVFAQSALLLAASSRIVVAPGIANIFARDAFAMANGARTLAEAFPGRFVLGLGVSHAPAVGARGGRYGRPVETMTAYLEAMAKAPITLRGA